MPNKFGPLPSRPPLKPKQPASWWLIILSVLQILTLLLVGGLFVLGLTNSRLIDLGNGVNQQPGQSSETPSTVTPAFTILAQTPTEEPAPTTPLEFFKFTTNDLAVEFTQPVQIAFDTNMEPASIRFELLKDDGQPFTTDQSGLQPGGNKVIVPASRFVGTFIIRAIDENDSVLCETSFTIKPPDQPALDNLLEIRPHIKIGEQYILLPGVSTIKIKDAAWQVDAETLDANIASLENGVIRMNGDKPDTEEVESDFDRTLLSLPISIKMPGVFESNGNEYVLQISIPLLAQTPLPSGTSGPLLNYDIFEKEFPGKPDGKILDDVGKFVESNNIFSLGNFKDDDSGIKYSIVMVIGNFNNGITEINDDFKQIRDNYTNQIEPYILPSQAVIKTNDPGNLVFFVDDLTTYANIMQGAEGAKFYVIDVLKDGRIRSVLFGVIVSSQKNGGKP